MGRNFKKIFFVALLTVFFIISNLVGLKYTIFMNLLVPVSFVTYPFVILGVVMLLDTFGKRETYYAIISAVFVQVFLLLPCILVTDFNTQSVIPDLYGSVDSVFKLDIVRVMSSLIAFMISCFVVMYFYKLLKAIGQKIGGVLFGSVFSIFVYGLINTLICYYNVGSEILLQLISSNLIISAIFGVVVTVLFYILKDKDCIYTEDYLDKSELNFNKPRSFNDKGVLEVLDIKETGKKTTSVKKKTKDTKGKTAKSVKK